MFEIVKKPVNAATEVRRIKRLKKANAVLIDLSREIGKLPASVETDAALAAPEVRAALAAASDLIGKLLVAHYDAISEL